MLHTHYARTENFRNALCIVNVASGMQGKDINE